MFLKRKLLTEEENAKEHEFSPTSLGRVLGIESQRERGDGREREKERPLFTPSIQQIPFKWPLNCFRGSRKAQINDDGKSPVKWADQKKISNGKSQEEWKRDGWWK